MTKCKNVPDYKKVKLSSLIPYVNNSRTHSDGQVAQIAASIKEFGFTNPVLIDGEGGIIAGHGRVMAARNLGLNEVPCIVLSHLSEAQKKAYIIADNQLPLNAGWDLDMLRVEIENLQEMDFDLDLLGFDGEFLSDIYDFEPPEPESGLSDEDDNIYTDKTDGLQYEPCENVPNIVDVYESAKVNQLMSEIESSNLNDDQKSFLMAAATRHYVFDYGKIADIYSVADKQMQTLMEKSALIIIDYEDAIKHGYVKLSKEIANEYLS